MMDECESLSVTVIYEVIVNAIARCDPKHQLLLSQTLIDTNYRKSSYLSVAMRIMVESQCLLFKSNKLVSVRVGKSQ